MTGLYVRQHVVVPGDSTAVATVGSKMVEQFKPLCCVDAAYVNPLTSAFRFSNEVCTGIALFPRIYPADEQALQIPPRDVEIFKSVLGDEGNGPHTFTEPHIIMVEDVERSSGIANDVWASNEQASQPMLEIPFEHPPEPSLRELSESPVVHRKQPAPVLIPGQWSQQLTHH